MANVAAGLLIVAASFLLASGISENILSKRKFLAEFALFVSHVQGEIDCYNRELGDIIARYIEENQNSEISKILSGKKDDEKKKNRLTEYIEEIKKLDKTSQKNYSEHFCERIKNELKTTEKSDAQKSDLLKKVIPLSGIAIFILLL